MAGRRGKKRNTSNTSGQAVSSASKRSKQLGAVGDNEDDAATDPKDFEANFLASVSNPAIKIALSNIISKSVKFLQEEIVALRKKNQTQAYDMTQLKRELASTRDDLEALKNCYDLARQELADLQQYTKLNALRIFNPAWKEQKDEDTDQIILTLANKLNVDHQAWEISLSHRVGVPQDRKGTSPDKKIFKARRLLKDKPALKNVYVNENLTKATNELAYKAS